MFSEMVQTNRRRLGLTQEELARKSGVSVRTVRDLESGRILRPRPVTLRRLADAFALQEGARDRFFEYAAFGPSGAATGDADRPEGSASVSILAALDAPAATGPDRYREPLRTVVRMQPAGRGRRALPVSGTVVLAAGGILALTVGSATVAYWSLVNRPEPVPVAAPTGDLAGVWRGVFDQSGSRRGSVELRVNAGALTASTTYLDLGCVGWAGIAELGLDNVKYQEHITSGTCSTDGFITLKRRADGRMDLLYVVESGTDAAGAVLHRVRVGTPK